MSNAKDVISKLFVIILLLGLLFGLVALLISSELNVGDAYGNDFTVVSVSPAYYTVYSNDTSVMYAVSRLSKTKGLMTLLINSDGSPLTYEGTMEVSHEDT